MSIVEDKAPFLFCLPINTYIYKFIHFYGLRHNFYVIMRTYDKQYSLYDIKVCELLLLGELSCLFASTSTSAGDYAAIDTGAATRISTG